MVFQLFFPAHQLRCFILTFFTEAYVFFLGLKCRRKEVFVLCFIANPKSRFQNLNPHFPNAPNRPLHSQFQYVCIPHALPPVLEPLLRAVRVEFVYFC